MGGQFTRLPERGPAADLEARPRMRVQGRPRGPYPTTLAAEPSDGMTTRRSRYRSTSEARTKIVPTEQLKRQIGAIQSPVEGAADASAGMNRKRCSGRHPGKVSYGSIATGLAEQKFRRCPLCSGSGSKVGRCRRFAMQTLGIRPPKQGSRETKRADAGTSPRAGSIAARQRLQESAGSPSLHELQRQP